MSRNLKKLLIVLIYFFAIYLIVLFFYNIFKPEATCFDGKKNQREEKIDCGGSCQPCEEEISVQKDIEVANKDFVYVRPNLYDVVVKISNPNNYFGASKFKYKISLVDAEKNILAEKNGESFILPIEDKHLIETNLSVQAEPTEVRVEINDVQWEEFSGYEEPQLNIYNKSYSEINSDGIFSEVFGLLRNESHFDFNVININIILRDASGNPVALNRTEMRTVSSGEERDFRLPWASSFSGEVMEVEVEAEADVYNSQNFTKRYLPKQKFQEY